MMPGLSELRRKAGLCAAALACVAGLSATAPSQHRAHADDACAAVAERITVARQARDLAALAASFDEASVSPCSEKARFCLGRSIALGFVAEVYARSRKEDGSSRSDAPSEEMNDLLTKGRNFGAPWQLLVAVGDLHLDRARGAHDPALFGQAAYDYQLALFDLNGEPACPEYGEPPAPVAPQIAEVYQRMSTALLLAAPIKIATSKCSVCQWAFLSGIRGFTPMARSLPITFASNSADPTPEGREAIAALLECLKAQKLPRIVLSGHTDQTGSAAFNMTLSNRRLAAVQQLLKQGGYTGTIVLEPKGKTEPYNGGDLGGYSQEEILRLNRRIELRAFAAGEAPSCSP
jgi:outer membrane protein OmpA-like peptidoglycan-associated protein